MEYLLLRSPSANRVYTDEASRLAIAELAITAPFSTQIAQCNLAGVSYLSFQADQLGPDQLRVLAEQSSALGLFELTGELLRPIALPNPNMLDGDLVTIPKYQGKTNEQFTRLLLNVTLACVTRNPDGPRQVLDPLCGRGTTLATAWLMGAEGYGVEIDEHAFEMMAAFLTTWLRRKRLKHSAETTSVKRDGRLIGKRFDAEVRTSIGLRHLTVFTGDTQCSAKLYGRKRFDAIVTDAPYGVIHGATANRQPSAKRFTRSPEVLLADALPVWVSQLKRGGALGISWNTYGITREELADLMTATGLRVQQGDPWESFAHRVDSSIKRDLMVGVLD